MYLELLPAGLLYVADGQLQSLDLFPEQVMIPAVGMGKMRKNPAYFEAVKCIPAPDYFCYLVGPYSNASHSGIDFQMPGDFPANPAGRAR
jgi:hypothetical protein